MGEYSVVLSRTAAKQLDKLPSQISRKLTGLIKHLAVDPRPPGCKRLRARKGYRLRSGDYRIIYDVYDGQQLVDVIGIGHRREVYE